MPDVRPDDVPRSKSGRVPQWVLDEAAGIEPRDLVPFRGAAPSVVTPLAPVRRRRKAKKVVRVVVSLAVVGGLVYGANTLGGTPPGGESIFARPASSSDAPPAGLEETPARLERAPVAGTSRSYKVMAFQDDRTTPVTWSPCRPLHYVVRPDNAPADGGRLLADAFATLSAATGLRFVDDGSTKEAPAFDRPPYQVQTYGNRWAPVLVTWATADEVADFGVDISGEAGPQAVRSGSGDITYVSGTVALSAKDMRRPSGSRDYRRLVILHELGHLVGLQHVNDAHQVMAPRGSKPLQDYQPGDLAGLALLGSGPCQRDV